MQYVYRYLDNSIPVYVGIASDLARRINQHKHDKLSKIKNPIIEYIPVENRGDAEILETYLINHYETAKGYNIKKTTKGKLSFLDVVEDIPWVIYNGYVNPLLAPFHVSDLVSKPKEVIVEKVVTVKKTVQPGEMSEQQKIDIYHNNHHKNAVFLKREEGIEIKLIADLKLKLREASEKGYEPEYIRFVQKGIELHAERLKCIRECLNRLWDGKSDPVFLQSMIRAGEILKEEEQLIQRYKEKKQCTKN